MHALPSRVPRLVPEPHRWKTSLLLEIANSPGSLNRALGGFALAGIDLSKIESRPIAGKPWEYAFYIDVVCNAADESITRAFGQLRTNADSLEVLGSYPTSW